MCILLSGAALRGLTCLLVGFEFHRIEFAFDRQVGKLIRPRLSGLLFL